MNRPVSLLVRGSARRFGVAVIALVLGGAGVVSAAPPPEIHVPGDYDTIQAAINAASVGSTILVGPNTYPENLTINKEIILESTNGWQTTIIDAGGLGNGVSLILDAGESPELRGFTIRNAGGVGYAGVVNGGGSPLIEDNVIRDNRGCYGSGMFIEDSAAVIANNGFWDNVADACSDPDLNVGGGIAVYSTTGVVPTIVDNVFRDNSSTKGGGLFVSLPDSAAGAMTEPMEIAHNLFLGNIASEQGGGIWLGNTPSYVFNNVFDNNTSLQGGAIYSHLDATRWSGIYHNTFLNNTATTAKAIYTRGYHASLLIANNAISGGTNVLHCNTDYTATSPDVVNNAFAGFSAATGSCLGVETQNANLTGKTNIDQTTWAPLAGSILIDAADPTYSVNHDYYWTSRPLDGDGDGVAAYDIGAVEKAAPIPTTTTTTTTTVPSGGPCPSGAECDSVMFQGSGGQFALWESIVPTPSKRLFFYGNPGDVAFSGDWDCDGVDTPGLYRRSDGYVYLRNSNTQGVADITFFFGNPGDYPIAGDFNGNGCDTVSIYRPSEARFYVINTLGSNDGGLGAADYSFLFGNFGDKPFVGDFNGNGIDSIGLHRESTGLVYFRNSLTTGIADSQFIYGNPGDMLVAGDWDGDGDDTVAVYRPSNGMFYVKLNNVQGNADYTYNAGIGYTGIAKAYLTPGPMTLVGN